MSRNNPFADFKLENLPRGKDLVTYVNRFMIGLSESERFLARSILHEWSVSGDDEIIKEAWNQEFINGVPPVRPEVFFNDPYYIGEFGKSIYECWKRDLYTVCDPDGDIEEWALVGAQRTGKTIASLSAQTYKLYQTSCLKDPQRYYGFPAVSNIYYGLFTLNREKADTELYDRFIAILEQSPYFRDRFPAKRRPRKLRMSRSSDADTNVNNDFADMELLFPRRLRVVAGSQTAHALSIDLMSCVLDELNWRRKKTIRPSEDMNSAQHLYEQIRTRIRGTFKRVGPVPGIICSISSRQSTVDFMEGITARMKKEPDRCYISDYALWEAKPDRTYSGKKFFVFVGNSYGQSHIIEPDKMGEYGITEIAADPTRWEELPPNIKPIPEEYRPEFDMNVNTGLRDIAGIATSREVLLFDNQTIIERMIDRTRQSPFRIDEITVGVSHSAYKDKMIQEYLDEDRITKFDGFTRRPRFHSTAPRFLHLDLSKNDDCTGIAMACPYDIKRITTRTKDGKPAITISPKIWFDFIIRLRAAQGDQIDYDKIRNFLMYLRRLHFPIKGISFDQYQSVDSMQLLAKAGFTIDNISVESDMPYLSFREAAVQRRINMYHYEPFIVEAKQLILDTSIRKVNHPDVDENGGPGSKDLTDAACGTYVHMMRALTADKASNAQKTVMNVGQIERAPSPSVMEMLQKIKEEPPLIDTGIHTDPGKFAIADYRLGRNDEKK